MRLTNVAVTAFVLMTHATHSVAQEARCSDALVMETLKVDRNAVVRWAYNSTVKKDTQSRSTGGGKVSFPTDDALPVDAEFESDQSFIERAMSKLNLKYSEDEKISIVESHLPQGANYNYNTCMLSKSNRVLRAFPLKPGETDAKDIVVVGLLFQSVGNSRF